MGGEPGKLSRAGVDATPLSVLYAYIKRGLACTQHLSIIISGVYH